MYPIFIRPWKQLFLKKMMTTLETIEFSHTFFESDCKKEWRDGNRPFLVTFCDPITYCVSSKTSDNGIGICSALFYLAHCLPRKKAIHFSSLFVLLFLKFIIRGFSYEQVPTKQKKKILNLTFDIKNFNLGFDFSYLWYFAIGNSELHKFLNKVTDI